jgi:choline dehydrogenase
MSTNLTFTCDTLVIGGGTAGAIIAGRLAADEAHSVVLLEAGPDYGRADAGHWPADLYAGRVVAVNSHDWNYTSAAANGKPNHALERARVLGGCSAHNGCIAIWGSQVDYDGWAALGNPGWATADLLPYFHKANEMLRVRRFAADEVTPFHAAALQAIQQTGVPLVDDLNNLTEDAGVNLAPVNMVGNVRWNSAFGYLDPIRHQANLTIRGDALVDKLILAGDQVVGVELIGAQGRERLVAGRVVLCAGAYGSPAILLRSGIGPADELRQLGIHPVLDRPGVGRNLHDHPAIYLHYGGSAELDRQMVAFVTGGYTLFTEQSLAKLRSDFCREAFDLHLYPCSSPTPNPNGRWEATLPIANMTPHSRGSVRLRDSNPLSPPVIDTGYLSDAEDRDLAVLWSGVAMAREIASQPPFAHLLGNESEQSTQIDSKDATRRHCLHYYHPVGSCKMGLASEQHTVVDACGQVHGIANLYIADASVMPVIPRANTNLPTAVVAERIAGWLQNQ